MDIVENQRRSRRTYDGDILLVYRRKDRLSSVSKTVQALRRQGKTVLAVREDTECDFSRWRKAMTLKEAGKEAGL